MQSWDSNPSPRPICWQFRAYWSTACLLDCPELQGCVRVFFGSLCLTSKHNCKNSNFLKIFIARASKSRALKLSLNDDLIFKISIYVQSARPTSDTFPWHGLGDSFQPRHQWDVIWLVLNGFLGTFKSIYYCAGKLMTKDSHLMESLHFGPTAPSFSSIYFFLFL